LEHSVIARILMVFAGVFFPALTMTATEPSGAPLATAALVAPAWIAFARWVPIFVMRPA